MKPLFIKKNGTVSKVSGIIMNLIPSYTMAEYNALTHKPLFWVRTDEEYAQIPSEDVSYGSGSVKDELDELADGLASKIGLTARISGTYTSNSGSSTITFPSKRQEYMFICGNIIGSCYAMTATSLTVRKVMGDAVTTEEVIGSDWTFTITGLPWWSNFVAFFV